MLDPSKLFAWTRVLYVTHKLTISDDPKWAKERKEFHEDFKHMGCAIKSAWHEARLAIDFEKSNPKPSVRIPFWQCCIGAFLPVFVVVCLSSLLPEDPTWIASAFVWSLIAWVAGSSSALFYMNRSSRATLRKWERRKEEYVASH